MTPNQNKEAANPKKLKIKILAFALKLLSFRPRSLGELQFRLIRKFPQSLSQISSVLEQLEAENLVNDQDFASWWVDQRLTHRPKGNIALTHELRQKHIADDIIKSVLLTSDKEKQLARQIISQKNLSGPKAISALKSRGFSSSVLWQIIDELSHGE